MLRLYPKAWRIRYGEEMSAVLDSHGVTWRTFMDLVLSATKTHLFWERKGLWRMQFTVGCVILSFLCLCGYTVFQQNMRHRANFPQQAIVQQTVTSLESGADVSDQIPQGNVNLQSSLSPFVIVYNNAGVAVRSNASVNGHTPSLPKGVLDYTRTNGIDKLTWQPRQGIRIAAVIEHFNGNGGGFVLGGRSLRIVEDHETALLRIVEWTWAVLLGGFSLLLFTYRRRRRTSL